MSGTPEQLRQRLAASLALADPAGPSAPEAACSAAREAMALAQALDEPADAALAGARLCEQLLRLGRHADVLTSAPPVLHALSQAPLSEALARDRHQLMRVFVMAACETADFDRALDTAHELVRLVSPLGDATASLKAAYALGACFERMGDSWQASRVLGEALGAHGPGALPQEQLATQNALCAFSIGLFHRLNGAAPQHEVDAVLTRALDAGTRAFERLTDPPAPQQEVAICGNLGEVLLHRGEHERALALMQRAWATAQARGFTAYLWRMRTTLATYDLLQGRPEAALADMQALVAEMGAEAPQQTAIRAHHAAYRACRALGRFEEALLHFETVERLERQRATQQLRAQSQLFVTRTEAQHAQWHAEQARLDAQNQRARAAEFAAHAERDPLTGLGNRRHFDRRCAELLPALQRDGEPVALVLLDIDHFKLINDAHGHAVGDRALVAMAALLRENTRSGDVLARYGGEEFVIVLPGMAPMQAREVCERLRERLAAHTDFCAEVPELRMTVSLGLAAAPPYDPVALLKAADLALYQAKRDGRNRLRVAPPALSADHPAVLAPDRQSR
jgi:diguanylate cyclase (GGDEF)-like protein